MLAAQNDVVQWLVQEIDILKQKHGREIQERDERIE